MRKIFHGLIKPNDFSRVLIAEFNHNNLIAQQLGSGNEIVVQITTPKNRRSGGQTALTVTLEKVTDGVAVEVGKQSWLGIAASLGTTALLALRNPFTLLNRLDDVAQDIESLQINDRIWEVVENVAYAAGATFELSERLRRLVCKYCDTANPVGEPRCIACGAPLGKAQPRTCLNCGYVIREHETQCPNCNQPIEKLNTK
jgi:hypothetical protein